MPNFASYNMSPKDCRAMSSSSLRTASVHLLDAVRQGDSTAGDELFRRIENRFTRICRKMLGRFPSVRGAGKRLVTTSLNGSIFLCDLDKVRFQPGQPKPIAQVKESDGGIAVGFSADADDPMHALDVAAVGGVEAAIGGDDCPAPSSN